MFEKNKYSILRIKKIKDSEQLISAGLHNSREIDVPNSSKEPGGTTLLSGSNKPEKRLEEILKHLKIKPRKNAVLAVEILLTFSPDYKDKINTKRWVSLNQEFIEKEFPRGSVLSAHLHTDETTPHIHVIIAPLKKKSVRGELKWRLCARDYFGGKEKLQALQDRYALAMAETGLVRGVKNSKAKHQTIKKFYSELDSSHRKAEELCQKSFFELTKNKSYISKVLAQLKSALMSVFKYKRLYYNAARELSKYKSNSVMRILASMGSLTANEAEKILKEKNRRFSTQLSK